MKVAIAALLLALGAGVAMAQSSTSPPTTRAPGATETPATGPATGTSPPRVQASGNSGRCSCSGDKRTRSGGAEDSAEP
jgi:hypothetical protein